MTPLKTILLAKYKRRIKERLGVPSLHWSLQNLKQNKFNPSIILDIGAFEGHWTMNVLEVFPDAKILMIEAQKNKESLLKNIVQNNKNVEYAIALVSGSDGVQILFRESEAASHIIKSNEAEHPRKVLYSQTVDTLLEKEIFHILTS